MQAHDEEYIAYRPDKYIQAGGDNPNVEDEDEFAFERALPHFKWNQFINDYNSLAASDISFKRVKRDDDAAAPPPDAPPADAAAPPEDGGAPADGAEGGASPEPDKKEIKRFMGPIIGLTAFFALLFIVGPFLVRKGPNRGIVQCSIMLSAFCMWIFWVTVYIGQMNPLLGPRLENTTIAWLSVKVGNAVKAPVQVTPGGAE